MVTQIDRDKLTETILAADTGGPAKEEGARLVEAWLEKLEEFPEFKWRVQFVEAPFYIQLQPKTWIVGQMDACFHNGENIVLGEWKSRRAPKLKKDGTNYAGDDENGWLEEITNGPQLGVYALAGREGTFLPEVQDAPAEHLTDLRVPMRLSLEEPHILVRAAVKSNPVEFWSGQFSFPGALLDTVKAALLSEAESIRARRKLGAVPFAIPGIHCTNMYHKKCKHYDEICQKRLTPPLEAKGWHPTDPGFVVPRLLGLDPHDPETIILSASALDSYRWCPEKGRIEYDGHETREEDFNIDVGTTLHTGAKEIYRQLQNRS